MESNEEYDLDHAQLITYQVQIMNHKTNINKMNCNYKKFSKNDYCFVGINDNTTNATNLVQFSRRTDSQAHNTGKSKLHKENNNKTYQMCKHNIT